MKKFILFIGLILNTLIGFSQIEFQSTLYNYYESGVEVGFEIVNTTNEPIDSIHIQLRRITPIESNSFGNFFLIFPPLQPNIPTVIYPFPNCIDVGFNMTFQARIYNIEGQSGLALNHEFSPQYNENRRCPLATNQVFCLNCDGLVSSIEDTPFTEFILKTEYYTTVGQNVPFEELQPNVLYIIKETTQTGFKIYKTIIQ